jgi:hypothetical protein
VHVVLLSTLLPAVQPVSVAPCTVGTVHFSRNLVLEVVDVVVVGLVFVLVVLDVVGSVLVLLVVEVVLDVVVLIRSM